MSLGSASPRRAIESALLAYHRSPGSYPLIRRQPPLLFASIKEVLQLASGRSPEGVQASGPSATVRQAACFFIRTALLYPDADHYALLGLDHAAEAAAIKDRYRLMMRLMHPDFSSSRGASWPADAASRVNKAYEELSSPDQRRAYDERLAPPAAPRPAAPVGRAVAVRTVVGKAQPEDPRRRLRQLATVFGAAGAVGLLAALIGVGTADKESLVQRARTVAALPASAAPDAAVAPPQIPDGGPPKLAAPASRQQALPAQETAAQVAATVATPVPLRQAEPPAAAMPVAAPAPAPATIAPGSLPSPVVAMASVASPPTRPATAAVAPNPGVTLIEVHPLLARLLQHMESGWGDRMLGVLEHDARAAPSAQAFVQHYNALVDGARPVRLSGVQFKSEPREGRLLVTGRVLVHGRDEPPGAGGKDLSLQAEFASRDGTVVMTRLARSLEQ